MTKRTVIILSISSDIGLELAKRYLSKGHRVIGTYRTYGRLSEIKKFPNCHLINCDIGKKTDIEQLLYSVKKLKIRWDTFISCVGDLAPTAPFFKSDFDKWSDSVHVNAIGQLRALHTLYPLKKNGMTNTVFFAGGGVNKAVTDITAYTVAKIMLIKMCEYLDAENKDLNIFIIGPGWTKTKIHDAIINNQEVPQQKREETREFIKKGQGTNMQDIFDCIEWAIVQGKKVAGGRNFSVAHDPWKGAKNKLLAKKLKADINMYKLRRWGSKLD